ncbi:MAG: hypothetical protein GY715_21720, partial [Planctomycetes bacterium]|nr:hypothetical protein [Planctomycetota bacterium]
LPDQERGHIKKLYKNEADPETNLTSVTDQEGNETEYDYNGRYLRTERTNALGDIYRWDYDENGNLVKETDEEKNETGYGYDARDRRVLVTKYPEGRPVTAKYDYDKNSNLTGVTDARLKVTGTEYDSWNRPWKTVLPDTNEYGQNYTTFTEYDGKGNTVRTVDGRGIGRRRERDSRGLVKKYTDGEEQN